MYLEECVGALFLEKKKDLDLLECFRLVSVKLLEVFCRNWHQHFLSLSSAPKVELLNPLMTPFTRSTDVRLKLLQDHQWPNLGSTFCS